MGVRKSLIHKYGDQIFIPNDVLEAIEKHRLRTGIGVKQLLKNRTNLPEGLKPETVHSWLRRATIKTFQAYIDCVLELWSALPDREDFDELLTSEKIPISKRQLNQLHAHYERTQIGVQTLYNDYMQTPPHGLTPNVIQTWLRGTTICAHPEHIEYTIQIWRKLPRGDKKRRTMPPLLSHSTKG